MGCLIVFRSVTYAQNAQNLLGKNHISAAITRPPAGLAKGGCSYALRLREGELEAALALLRRSPVAYTGAFCPQGRTWREVGV